MVKPVGRRLAYALVLGLAVAGFGCSDSGGTTTGGSAGSTGNPGTGGTTPPVAGAAQTIAIVSGDGQSGAPSGTLALPLIVKVADANGVGVSGVSVEFLTEGSASFTGGLLTAAVTTGSDGQASLGYTLGSSAGIYNALVRVPSLANSAVSFKATATTGVVDPALLATVAVGSLPQGINLNPTTNKIYVGNNGNKNGCDYAVFSNATSTTMTVIDGGTNTPTSVTVGNSPIYPVANASLNRVYVANSGTGSVTVLNGVNNQLIATTTGLGAVHQPAVDTATGEVWVNDSSGNQVWVLDSSGNILNSVPTINLGPHGLTINSTTGRVYTSNVESKTVTVIDTTAMTKVTDVGPFSADALGIAVNTLTNTIYVGTAIGKKLVVINGANNSLLTEIDVTRHVLEVAVDEARNRIYATSQTMPYSVAVIDGATNTVLGFHPVGLCPWGVAYNPTTDRLYVGNQGENTVSVLDASQLL